MCATTKSFYMMTLQMLYLQKSPLNRAGFFVFNGSESLVVMTTGSVCMAMFHFFFCGITYFSDFNVKV